MSIDWKQRRGTKQKQFFLLEIKNIILSQRLFFEESQAEDLQLVSFKIKILPHNLKRKIWFELQLDKIFSPENQQKKQTKKVQLDS